MIAQFTSRVQETAFRTAQNAVLGLGGVVALGVGTAFLTLSAWLYLISVTEPVLAALIIGGVYFGGGLIMFAVISSRNAAAKRKAEREAARAPQKADVAGLVTAFLTGVTAGSKARS